MYVFEGIFQVTVSLPQSIMELFPHLPLVLAYLATLSTQPQLKASSPAPVFLGLGRNILWGFHLSTTLILVIIPPICTTTPACLAMPPLRITSR